MTTNKSEYDASPDLDGDVEFLAPPPEAPPPPPPATQYPQPAAEPVRRRVRILPRSLTAKLVTGVTALVLVVVIASGTATYYALRSFLFNRLDQQVTSSAQQNGGYFAHVRASCTVTAAPSCIIYAGLPPSTSEYIGIIAAGGVPASVTIQRGMPGPSNIHALKLTKAQAANLESSAGVREITVGDESLRVVAQPANDGYTIITGLSTDDVTHTLGRLIGIEIIIGALAVALALVATTYGVQFSLRRLKRVTRTAQEVAAELSPEGAGLERRVPVVEEGTEVGQLAESMNTLLSAVEIQFAARVESERRMRQFLADASHELRTPLTSIRGFAELARMQRAANVMDDGSGGYADNLDRIESEGTRMSRLVEDLLLLARGDSPDSDADPVRHLIDVGQLLDDAVGSSRAAFPQRAIELAPDTHQQVLGDTDQLVRAIRNLIANAAVHTAPERPIRVRAFTDGPGVAIQVIDGGPGLPPEEAAHVFERFWRADKARTRVRGGSGLGLSIVASILRAHGGTVHFDSAVETGSTVTIWLPSADS